MPQRSTAKSRASRKSSSQSSLKPRRWPIFVVGIAFALIVLGGVMFVGASALEDHDSFCASCHTVPEITYTGRAAAVVADTKAPLPDLASAHYQLTQAKNQTFTCISCHRGDASLPQRFQALALGGKDTLINILGRANPAIEKTDISDPFLTNSACMSCHTDTLLTVKGLQSHFHNFLPQTAALLAQGRQLITGTNTGRERRMRTVDVSLACTDCHLAHTTANLVPQLTLIDANVAQTACDICHEAAGQERHSIQQLLRGDD